MIDLELIEPGQLLFFDDLLALLVNVEFRLSLCCCFQAPFDTELTFNLDGEPERILEESSFFELVLIY